MEPLNLKRSHMYIMCINNLFGTQVRYPNALRKHARKSCAHAHACAGYRSKNRSKRSVFFTCTPQNLPLVRSKYVQYSYHLLSLS